MEQINFIEDANPIDWDKYFNSFFYRTEVTFKKGSNTEKFLNYAKSTLHKGAYEELEEQIKESVRIHRWVQDYRERIDC